MQYNVVSPTVVLRAALLGDNFTAVRGGVEEEEAMPRGRVGERESDTVVTVGRGSGAGEHMGVAGEQLTHQPLSGDMRS